MSEVVKRSIPEEVNANLAALVLEEVPRQMVKCYKEKGIAPAIIETEQWISNLLIMRLH
jgi:hypothetical protein